MAESSSASGPQGKAAGAAPPGGVPDPPRGLPFVTRLVILVGLLVLFLLARGPLWRHPWDADAFDSAVFWSYVPIPPLVAGGLLLARRFTWLGLFLESLILTLLKYAITFGIALVLFATHEPPPPPPREPPHPAAPAAPPPTPTPIAAERTGSVHGTVKNAAGEPVAGAFVYVASGLEAFVFAPPSEPVRVENDGAGVHPVLVVARAGQPIEGRSLDGHLHTLVASGDTTGTTFNIPMMSSGAWSTVVVREAARVSRLRCTVHPQGEAPAYLVVLEHPFSTTSAADGSFRLDGIPAAKITLAAWHATAGEAARDLEITAQGSAEAELKLAAADAH